MAVEPPRIPWRWVLWARGVGVTMARMNNCPNSNKDLQVTRDEIGEHGWWRCPACGALVRVTAENVQLRWRVWVPRHAWN